MWVSTGNAGCPNPCDITTLAVLWPTPGKLSRSLKLSGTFELNLSTIILDRLNIFKDFWGASTQDLIIISIYNEDIFKIFAGVLAFLKSSGVTWFTLSSVHWALNKTAINNSNSLLWFSGIGVSG